MRTEPLKAGHEKSSTVLVVEDDAFIRLDLAAELRSLGHVVLEASSVRQALDLFASGYRADLVFSDLHLVGDATGWDLRLALAESHPDVGFILTSGREPPPEAAVEGLSFVPKPYQLEMVADLIEKELQDRTYGDDRP